MRVNLFIAMSAFLFLEIIDLKSADNGVWVNQNGGDWTTSDATNWVATPGTHPSGQDAIVGFLGFPGTAGQTITSTTTDITLSSLHIDTVFPISIDFSTNNHQLIFSDSVGVSEIFFANSSRILQGAGAGTRATLLNDLDIFVEESSQPIISGAIAGTGGVSLYGSNDPNFAANILTLSGSNSYTGGTNVYTALLQLGGVSNTTVIPKALSSFDISVFQGGHIHHANNNHYAPNVSMLLNGGSIDLLNTTQTMTQVKLENGAAIEDSIGGGNLILLQTAPGFAITIGSNSIFGEAAPYTVTLNGGGIQYDNSSPGPGFFAESVTFDLGGTVEFYVPHNRYNCFDVDVGTSVFQNNTLNKTGDGSVLFEGGTVPIFNIREGVVIIGDQPPAIETVTATGVVTVSPGAVLGGFQTLDAQQGVINNGTISPGSSCPCNSIGQLTINGSYSQTSSGTLNIVASSPSNASLLSVQKNSVNLDGTLSLDSLPGAVLNVGDTILVLDNTIGTSLPITGQFASLVSNLPPELSASIIQDPNQVFILIGPCTVLNNPSLTNFINLSFPFLSNTHSLLQRERILRLRENICNESCACDLSPSIEFYVAYLGSIGDVEQIQRQEGYDYHTEGGLVGINYAWPKVGFGFEGGYERVDADVDDNWGNFDVPSVFGSFYLSVVPIERFFIDLSMENRINWFKIHRLIGGFTATGNPHSWQWDSYLDVGYDFFGNGWSLTPLASFEANSLHIDDYTEKGAGDFNVRFNHQNFLSLRTWLGMSASIFFEIGSFSLIPEMRGYWLHELGDKNKTLTIASPTYNTTSKIKIFGGPRNLGDVGLDLQIQRDRFSFEGSYDYYWNDIISVDLFYAKVSVSY